MYFLECLLICNYVYQMSNRRLLDVFKMFMIYNVCKIDILQTSVGYLYTTDAFQIKQSLTDIVCYLI